MDSLIHKMLKRDLMCQEGCCDDWKDILIVTKDHLEWLQTCVESIFEHTDLFHLYIWDNASEDTTYLDEISDRATARRKVTIHRADKNYGFIEPNNRLSELGDSYYVILLNSDTEVYEGWDKAMLGSIQDQSDIKQVGYMGGLLDDAGRGIGAAFGDGVDYIMGWCMCLTRPILQQHTLFDENLKFAYGEDADLSLRLKEAGAAIHALHIQYVHHEGNITAREVEFPEGIFEANLAYIQRRWAKYLAEDRILLNGSVGSPVVINGGVV